MKKRKIPDAGPEMLQVLDEFDLIISIIRKLIDSSRLESISSVDLRHVLVQIERLREQVACMSHKHVNWAEILQALACIAQFLTSMFN